MGRATRATRVLERAGVPFRILAYTYDPAAARVGLQAAEALGEAPARVLKTLMVRIDGRPACAILASDREASIKRLASSVGAKTAAMMTPAEAERISGYKVGGISPFGQTRLVHSVIDVHAITHPRVFVNAGQRGLQLELSPHDAVRVLGATVAPIGT